MRTTTMNDRIEDIHRRIDLLKTFAQVGAVADSSRIRRHVDALHRAEAAAGDVGQLSTRLAVAENSLLADVSDEWPTFRAIVEDELRSWDAYLERLQATAVAKAGTGRGRAETAMADVRTQRIAVYDRLAQARDDVNGAWHEQRKRVNAARDELERKADELSAQLT